MVMKICMITWEYPPRIVGGIARHCEGLAKALTHYGHDVHIFTLDFPGAPSYEETDGVKVHRVKIELGHPDFITWVLLFNHFIEKQMADVSQFVKFDLVHVHDWLVALAGISFKHFLKKPMVLTFHSTEFGRSGLHNPDSFAIDGVEWWASYEAARVIVTSNYMRREVCKHFKLPWDKIEVIPNGIDLDRYRISVNRYEIRERYGVHSGEKLILFVGRLVPQKGVEHLIRAIPLILEKHPEAKFIIVGEGWMKDRLEALARSILMNHQKIMFTGFIPDNEVIALMASADALVIPSIYEPFGIVALEGMAVGVPVVASQVGGLAEVVEHDKTGVLVYPENPESIAWGVNYVLSNPEHSNWLVYNAREMLQKTYSWEAIARKTIKVYERTVG